MDRRLTTMPPSHIVSDASDGLVAPLAPEASTLPESPSNSEQYPYDAERRQPLGKQVFDRAAAGLLLIAALPGFLVVALLVACGSRGPILYRQVRIGQHFKPFTIYKFRTMKVNADAELYELLAAHGRETEPHFKVPNDPRITRTGKWLRKFSLDELPQLWNVIRGDMSLVGPRPQVAEEVAMYDDYARQRCMAKPGMTGLWQVNGRSDLSSREAIGYDVEYVKRMSPAFDAAILLRTIIVVLSAEGAA